MQNNGKCDLCNSKEFEECYELNCCQKKYCKFCMIHLKADNLSKCQICKKKLSFNKLFTEKLKLKKKNSEPSKQVYLEKKLILE